VSKEEEVEKTRKQSYWSSPYLYWSQKHFFIIPDFFLKTWCERDSAFTKTAFPRAELFLQAKYNWVKCLKRGISEAKIYDPAYHYSVSKY
jgi:hypothetical protein